MKKIIFISNIIAPYRIPFFNELSKCDNISLNVLYVALSEKNRTWNIDKKELKYAYNIIPGFHIPYFFKTGTIHISYNYKYFFDMADPDVIVLGTDLIGSSISWSTIRYAKKRGISLIRFEGQHCSNNPIGFMKSIIYNHFYKLFDGFFVYSHLTKNYLIKKYNVSDNIIKIGYNVGDLSRFFKNKYYQENNGEEIKILFCGSLDNRKNIIFLMNILKEKFDKKNLVFTIVGDGPYLNKIKSLSKKFVNMKIKIKGSLYNDKLMQEYAANDIFILPSIYDAASIVITEALASGLFVIGSKFDGSAINFIQDKFNGILIDPYNTISIAESINFALDHVQNKSFDKNLIKQDMKKYSIENYARNFSSWDLIE